MESWDTWYIQAQKYYIEYGNLDVPSTYIDKDGMKLGRWLNQQRAKYKGTDSHGLTLSDEKIAKLEVIGIVWDRLEKAWSDYFLSATKYYHINGDLLVPIWYVDETGLKLGQWISKQRQYYYGKSKRGFISEERVRKLESIGMVWNPIAVQWEKNYGFAKEFFLTNGHLCVPKEYIVENEFDLGSWVRNQRNKYHSGDGELTEEQIDRLENIGMVWNPYDEEWMRNYFIAKKYYEENNNLLVPLRYISNDGTKLGYWIGRQRRKKYGARGNLTDAQEKMFCDIGMVWDPNEAHFEECFSEAIDYYNNIGDLEIDSTYISPSGRKLGIWIANLRRAYKNNSIDVEKITRLEKIGMLWEVKNSASQTSYPEQVLMFYLAREFGNVINRYTELGFEIDIYIPDIRVGVEYDGFAWHKNKQDSDNNKNIRCKENNIVLIRLREEGCPELNGLSIDINVGRYSIQNVIEACRILFSLLVEKGYILSEPSLNYTDDISAIRNNYKNAKNESWDRMYHEAELFYAENGNLRIPYNYVTDTGLKLGAWITNQRNNYAGHSGVGIDSKRIELLEKIGMIWSVPEDYWESGYKEAKEYFVKKGNLKVSANYVSENGFRLGVWIRTQRKNESLSDDQRELLDEIGMVWSVFDGLWENGIEEAKKYYSTNGHLRVPAGYISDTGFNLGNWIATQRSKYLVRKREKELTSEQIEKLENIGMIWKVFDDAWEQGFIHAKDYYEKFGNLLVPTKYVCSDGYALGNWIQCRRGGYNGTGSWAKPSAEQIIQLEQIGMVWDVEENN